MLRLPILVALTASSSALLTGLAAERPLARTTTTTLCASSDSSLSEARSLLNLLGSRRSTTEAKEEALRNLQTRADRGEAVLDDALQCINDRAGMLAARRWPIPLPSRRAVLGSYGRLLEGMEAESPASEEVSDAQRRRRLLLVLFRQLPNTKGTWALEREVTRRRRLSSSIDEMLARTPDGLETPQYDVLDARANWEVRRYAEFSVATTARMRAVSDAPGDTKISNPTMSAAGGFQALASYIFGKNQASTKMAMTTPVLSTESEMSFVLPSDYWQGTTLPPDPVDGSVRLCDRGGGVLEQSETLACLWFGGFAGAKEVAQRKQELRDAVDADDEWEVTSDEALQVLMQYNDPFTPPWKRRNEVVLPVRAAQVRAT